MNGSGIKVVSLFNGISCGMVALERLGIPIGEYVSYEIDENANAISKQHYPDIKYYGDVFEADFTQHKPDLLIGGSPCIYWSIANTNRETSLEGTGGDLFAQYLRALREMKPRYFLYENNASISQDVQDAISAELGVACVEIDSALFSAQSRKRCYWTNLPFGFLPFTSDIYLEDILQPLSDDELTPYEEPITEKTVINETLLSRFSESPLKVGDCGDRPNMQGYRIYSTKGKSVTLTASGGGKGRSTGLYCVPTDSGSDKPYIIRRLTPLEAERLQTLPDNYTKGFTDKVRYKHLGNGWTVDVICFLLSALQNEFGV